jgi:hypothetical protein
VLVAGEETPRLFLPFLSSRGSDLSLLFREK